MEPEFVREKGAVYSNEEKDNLKEPVIRGRINRSEYTWFRHHKRNQFAGW